MIRRPSCHPEDLHESQARERRTYSHSRAATHTAFIDPTAYYQKRTRSTLSVLSRVLHSDTIVDEWVPTTLLSTRLGPPQPARSPVKRASCVNAIAWVGLRSLVVHVKF